MEEGGFTVLRRVVQLLGVSLVSCRIVWFLKCLAQVLKKSVCCSSPRGDCVMLRCSAQVFKEACVARGFRLHPWGKCGVLGGCNEPGDPSATLQPPLDFRILKRLLSSHPVYPVYPVYPVGLLDSRILKRLLSSHPVHPVHPIYPVVIPAIHAILRSGLPPLRGGGETG